MTCADNCSSYSHDRAAVVAAALAGCSVGVAVAKGVTSPPLDHPPQSSYPPCTTNQIQMHIPNNHCTHSRAVDEIMVDCTLHAAVVHSASPTSPDVALQRSRAPSTLDRKDHASLRRTVRRCSTFPVSLL